MSSAPQAQTLDAARAGQQPAYPNDCSFVWLTWSGDQSDAAMDRNRTYVPRAQYSGELFESAHGAS